MTTYHVGQRLVLTPVLNDGLCHYAEVVQVTASTVSLKWNDCPWENEYTFGDPFDERILRSMTDDK